MTISQNAARARKILTSGTLAREKVSNSAYKTPPLVRYRRCTSIGKCRSVPRLVRCPEFGGCPLFGSCKCIASTGIAVGTSTVVRYSVSACASSCFRVSCTSSHRLCTGRGGWGRAQSVIGGSTVYHTVCVFHSFFKVYYT